MEVTKTVCSRRSILAQDHYLSYVVGDEDEGIEFNPIKPFKDTSHAGTGSSGSGIMSEDEHVHRLLGGRKVESSRSQINVPDSSIASQTKKSSSGGFGFDYTDMPMKIANDVAKGGIKRSTSEKRDIVYKFNWFDFIISVASILIFFLDIGTDIKLAVDYLLASQWFHAAVTTALIVGPSLVTCCFGLHWYHIDYKSEQRVLAAYAKHDKSHNILKTSSRVWFLRVFFTILPFGPVVRTVQYIYYGCMSRSSKLDEKQRKRFHWWMLYEEVDNCLLRLFECFLESAPQLAWQLYIVISTKSEQEDDPVSAATRTVALLSSWVSLAVSLVSYQRSLRNSREDKEKMTLRSIPFFFVWRASETGGRILCLAMFALASGFWVFAILLLHWLVISLWLMNQRTTFYKNRCLEKVFNIICGYVMIFCFLNLREGHTRYRFLFYYFIFYGENFVMLIFWMHSYPQLGGWFHIWGFITVMVLFVLHIFVQLLYYTFFHPTKNIQYCLPCDKYTFYNLVCYDDGPEIEIAVGSPTNYSSKERVHESGSETVPRVLLSDSAAGDVQDSDDITIVVTRPTENGREQNDDVKIFKKRRSSGLQKVKRPRNSQCLES